MNVVNIIDFLERFGLVLPVVVKDVSPDDAHWKPADGAWSVLEIVNHLADEEIEDFRARLKLTLENPGADWPPIDPPRWALERKYNEQDLQRSVLRFVDERRKSVRWLRSLKGIDWSIARVHPKLSSIRAGDLLVSWAAHDALHLRQIAKRMHQFIVSCGGAYSADYAGAWTS